MILQFRATIPESKVFFRVYEVKGDMTLFKFNSFITNNLGFSPDQMVLFEGYDEEGKLSSEYGLFDMGDGSMDKITFDMILAKGEREIHYVFDIRNDRYVRFVFEAETEEECGMTYPVMTEEKGHCPDQFSVHYEDYEAAQETFVKVRGNSEYDDDEDFDDDDEDDDNEDGDDETEEIFDENELDG